MLALVSSLISGIRNVFTIDEWASVLQATRKRRRRGGRLAVSRATAAWNGPVLSWTGGAGTCGRWSQ